MRFNTKTQKGITQSTITAQGEMFVQERKIKRISPTEYFASRGIITTCNLDTPHFAFRTPADEDGEPEAGGDGAHTPGV